MTLTPNIISVEDVFADVLSPLSSNSIYRNTGSNLKIDLNIDPYYDDFRGDSNYHRILFRPGFAVQSRELTQLQSILQNQISKFGKHVFQEGSIVLGGAFVFENRVSYIKVADTLIDTNDAYDIESLLGLTFISQTTGMKGTIYKVVDGNEDQTNTKTLYVLYTNSGNNGSTKSVAAEEALTTDIGILRVLDTDKEPTGFGSIFLIREGVVFAKDHFISFPTQSIVVSRYERIPTARVGFYVEESISNFADDTSLLDPALQSSNYSAPGADRLKLTPKLITLEIDEDTSSPDYVDLITFKEGIITESKERTQYARIRDEMAKRTFDESGDYYVNGFSVRLREHLDNNVNGGLLKSVDGGDETKLAVGIEPGVAYVKGYEVGKLVTEYVKIDKSTAYANVEGQIVSSSLGNYFVCDEVSGTWIHDEGKVVSIYDQPQTALTSKTFSGVSPAGQVIATAKIKAVEHEFGLLGSPKAQVRVYLFDIKQEVGFSLSQARSIYATNVSGSDLVADIILESGNAILKDTDEPILIYRTGSTHTRSIKGSTDNFDASYTHKRTKTINITSSGTFDLSVDNINNEIFGYGSGSSLGTGEKREITLNFNTSFNIAVPGGITLSTTSNIATGNSTCKFTRFNPGDKIAVDGNTYFIDRINSDQEMILTTNAVADVTLEPFSKSYRAGDIVDLAGKGVTAGETRTVQQSTNIKLDFDLKENLGSTRSASISYRIVKKEGTLKHIRKVLRPNRYVQIRCSDAGITGPFSLGVSDVYKIREIRKNTGSFSTESDGANVTEQFVFDNGQRDELYDHATITPTIQLSDTDYLLVKFDYFHPEDLSGSYGYFSVDSYPVNDVTISDNEIQTFEIPIYKSKLVGETYDLRNCLDFRPVKEGTISDSDAQSVSGSTPINPTLTDAFVAYGGLGIGIPAPDSQITFDYSFYMSRRDLVCIDKDGNIKIITGIPSVLPVTPSAPDNLMVLASIFVAPYPSISPFYANKIGRADLSSTIRRMANIRHTMRDIGVLKQRIENLEYYVSLNSLEKDSISYTILDRNGLDRFKNGIFVDTFRDHTLGATNRFDYRISVDSRESSIRPVYDMNSIYYEMVPGTNTNVVLSDTILTLEYTEESFLEQSAVTTYRNNETSIYKYVGLLLLDPDLDVWIDTQTNPDLQVTFGSEIEGGHSFEKEWNAWEKKVIGYKVYRQYNNQLLGVYATEAEAQAAAVSFAGSYKAKKQKAQAPYLHVYIEESYELNRTGTQQVTSVQEETQSLGDRVIDVELIPYIRPQSIRLYAQGVKPNTRFFVYFDGENMTQYVTPAYNDWIQANINITNGNVTGFDSSYSEGDNLFSNDYGEVWATLRLPEEKKFRVGTKEVIITDSPLNDDSATSLAKSYFVASGIKQTKQSTILTTRTLVLSQNEISDYDEGSTQTVVNSRAYDSCSAYTFLVKAPDKEEGLFLSSVDVWFAGVDPNDGVWFEIREMSSDGGITRTQVPLSEVTYYARDIEPYILTPEEIEAQPTQQDKINLFEQKKFRVKFKAPIFLYNNQQYAFIMHTIGPNYNTYFWMSKLSESIDEVDLITGNPITSRILTGTLFTTNNNLNWDPQEGWDLKVRFNRAKFEPTGSVIIGNESFERVVAEASSNNYIARYGTQVESNKMSLIPVSGGSTSNDIINIRATDLIETTINVTYTNTVTDVVTVTTETVIMNVIGSRVNSLVSNTFFIAPNRPMFSRRGKRIGEKTSRNDNDDYEIDLDKWTKIKFGFRDLLSNNKIIKILNSNGTPKTNSLTNQPIVAAIANLVKKKAILNKFENRRGRRIKEARDQIGQSILPLYTTTTVVNTTSVITRTNTFVEKVVTTGSYVADLIESTGNFEANDIVYVADTNEVVSLEELPGFAYSLINYNPSELNFNKTGLFYEFRGAVNQTSPTLTAFRTISPDENLLLNQEYVLLSKSEENSKLSGNKSNQVRITMSSQSDYLSPVVDLGKTQSIMVYNKINDDFTSETLPIGGNLINKYITYTMTLAEGQDAEDVKVYATVYRPSGSDINVWMKIRHDEDIETIDFKDWVRLIPTSPDSYSSSSNYNDWIDYEYDLPKDEYYETLTLPLANTLPAGLNILSGFSIEVAGEATGTIIGTRPNEIYIVEINDGDGFTINTTSSRANVINTTGHVVGNTRIYGVGKTPHVNTATDIVEYTTQSGVRFQGYKQFQFKVGLSSQSSVIVPRVADIRTIQLQS